MRGGKRQRPNGVYDSWASVRVGGWPGHQQGSAEREILLLLLILQCVCVPLLFPVPRVKRDLLEVGISGHGADRCDQDDEIYIMVQEIWSESSILGAKLSAKAGSGRQAANVDFIPRKATPCAKSKK